jgi:hypothetical protein
MLALVAVSVSGMSSQTEFPVSPINISAITRTSCAVRGSAARADFIYGRLRRTKTWNHADYEKFRDVIFAIDMEAPPST